MTVCGIVLAAGAGTRYGQPKALARDADGVPWVARVVDTLVAAGCAPVFVMLGAQRAEAAALVPAAAMIVGVADWADGLSASVRAGLGAASTTTATGALVVPVDVPEVATSACRRVMARAGSAPDALVQATYAGAVGHPVLIGRAFWRSLAEQVRGDRGAGPYLRAHGALAVECGDLWHGRDVDIAS